MLLLILASVSGHAEVARASTATAADGNVSFTAAPGERNVLRLTATPAPVVSYYFYDSGGSAMQSGDGCNANGPSGAGCGDAGTRSITITLGDGDDALRQDCSEPCEDPRIRVPLSVDGGPGADDLRAFPGGGQLLGGPGKDTLSGNSGDDVIDARDGEGDVVVCGAGRDTVRSDPQDKVSTDCELVDNGTPASPPGPLGASIDAGARYTNDPNVTVTLRWPRLAGTLFISNDGGFADAEQRTVAETIPWTLDSSGPERLPKTIYVRFLGGDAGAETYQDDIILDQTPPTVSASAARPDDTATASTARDEKAKVSIEASDKTSGVAGLQVTSRRSRPGRPRAFSRTIRVAYSPGRPIYVRVADFAGNRSKWRKVRWR